MSPIRIAHIVEATVGGVARHLLDLVTYLDPTEYISVLYLSFQRPDAWTGPLRALAERGITVRELPMARVPNPGAVRQLRDWLQQDAVDLVHLHSAKAGYLGRQATETLPLPVVYTPHAFPFQRTTDWRRPWYRMIERRLAARTAKIICVSAGEFDEALAAGLPEHKLTVIPNGIDPTLWPMPTRSQREDARAAMGIGADEVVIGAMARLAPQKGIDLLLIAAEELLPDFPEARLIVWGDGPQRRMLQRMARRIGLKRALFPGETHEPWRAYAAMDIFCAPSRWEAGPYAVLEAMSCGLPVVASAVPGHIDYLEDGESGLIVATELPGPLDGALRMLLSDADLRETMGRAAHRRVLYDFTVEAMAGETAALYRTLMSNTPPLK